MRGLKSHHAARFLSRIIERSRKRSQSRTDSQRYRTRQLGERRPDPLASPAFAAFAQSIQARRPGRLRRCSRQAQSLCWGLRNGKSRPSQGRLLIKKPAGRAGCRRHTCGSPALQYDSPAFVNIPRNQRSAPGSNSRRMRWPSPPIIERDPDRLRAYARGFSSRERASPQWSSGRDR